MGALSFKGQFVPKVIAGLKHKPGGKRQSIRNFRKRPLKVGEPVYLYFAMRTKWCKKIGESVIKSVQEIRIDENEVTVYDILIPRDQRFFIMLKFNRAYKTKAQLDRFAKADGFRNWETMKRWWKLTHGT